MAAPFYPVNFAGAPTSGVKQVETATVVGDITVPGDAEVIVTANGMNNSPKTFAIPLGGVLQQETAEVIGTITQDGDAEVIVTANGMTGSPKTVAVTVDDGTAQVETATVVGTIDPAGAGDVEVVVTATGMPNSPKTVAVAVANDDTASDVAGKIRTALIADEDIGDAGTGFFTVSGSGANIVLTKNVKAANDATLNISIDNDTSIGLTAAPTSANTTSGVAPDNAAAVAGKIRTALIADADIGDPSTGFFTVTGSGANIILTKNVAAANDATMNISIDNDTCAGLTAAPTSQDTTSGGAGATAAEVAAEIRAALEADSDIAAFFTVGGSGANIILTRLRSAANDGTMNISIDNDTCEGLTPAATSTNTTAGVHGTYRGIDPGQKLVDTTNGHLYENTGDVDRPVWTLA